MGMDYTLGEKKTQGRKKRPVEAGECEVTKEKSELTVRILERGTKLSVL